MLTEPHLIVVFARELLEGGDASHLRSASAAVARLLEELAAAGVEQVIVVCPDSDRVRATSPEQADGLARSRVAEHLAAAETAAVRDAVRAAQEAIQGAVSHSAAPQPDRPPRFRGHLRRALGSVSEPGELMDRGYEDAYRQFIEPVVGGAES